MSFTNLYYKRTAGTARSCYICYKPTTTVLATLNAIDFLYTCPTHLSDRGFATPVGDQGTQKLGLTPEELAKVKEEWEAVQKKKAEGKEKEEKAEEEKAEKKEKVEKEKAEKEKREGQQALEERSSSPASHERYTLHRDYFAMRLAEHRKRRQAGQAKELGPRLPSAPSGAPL